jgi:hypothetical protein
MEYTATSIKEVIMRVIRDLDNKLPSRFVDSMLEWIPEAMGELETPYTLMKCSTPDYGKSGALHTKNYAVSLPCGLVTLLAVEDQYGNRVHRTGQQTDITSGSALNSSGYNDGARTTDFQTSTDEYGNGEQTIPWDGSDIVPVQASNQLATYDIKFNYLQTSEECMFVKLHYEALPIDKEGYPLIPNVQEYKEALKWYIMEKLIGAGFPHPTIPNNLTGLQYCRGKYDHYSGQALGKIKMPDQDRMARLHYSFVRLIPPTHFYDDFFIGSSQQQDIRHI